MFQFSCRGVALVGSALLLVTPSAPVAAEDAGTIEEIVTILRNEGLIDEATQQKLLVKHASERRKNEKTSGVLEGFEWSADLRLRHEAFWFDGDASGTPEPDNRYRFRYQARVDGTVPESQLDPGLVDEDVVRPKVRLLAEAHIRTAVRAHA